MADKSVCINVLCDIYFGNEEFPMKYCKFKFDTYEQYANFRKFKGAFECDYHGYRELVNMDKVCHITIYEDDYVDSVA